MIAKLEAEDLLPFIPMITEKVREQIEGEKFISYPKGLMEHYSISKPSAYRLWTKKGFPQTEIEGTGVRGVRLNDLKEFERNNKR